MSESPTRWRAPPPEDLLWMEDGPRAVVFDRRSQQTHVLNPDAAAALRLLADGALDAAELGRRLARSRGPVADESAADESAADLMAEILRTFDALGLVEPVRP